MLLHFYKNFSYNQLFWFLIFLAFLLSIFFRVNLDYNTLHFDEAGYLFVGQKLLSGGDWPTKTYVFSSDLPLMLLAFFQQKLGGYGGRIFSSAISMLSLIFFYKLLEVASLSFIFRCLALALASLQVSHIAISRLATYDALCFFFVMGSIYYGVLSIIESRWRWIIVSSVMFVLAVLSKYIAIAYFPVFLFLLFLYSPLKSLVFFWVSFPILFGYVFYHYESLVVLFNGQVQGSHAKNVSYWALSRSFLSVFWPILLGFIVFVVKGYKKITFRMVLVFIGMAFPIISYHYYNKDFISFYKHSVYCAFAMSFFMCFFAGNVKGKSLFGINLNALLSVILSVSMVNSFYWVYESEKGWPNYRELYSFINFEVVSKPSILSEDPYNFRYRYAKLLPLKNIKDVNWFDYNNDGVREKKDVFEAVKAGAFSYIALDASIRPNLVRELQSGNYLAGYERVYFEPNVKISSLVNRNTKASLSLYRLKE